MLEQVLYYLNNWFVSERHFGTFRIKDGSIDLPFLLAGQYYRIVGSTFNDGLHRQGEMTELQDEEFVGAIWPLAIPASVISISADIKAWQDKNKKNVDSPYTSESFGGYSYTKATDSVTGGAITWQSAFRSKLAPWRKLP